MLTRAVDWFGGLTSLGWRSVLSEQCLPCPEAPLPLLAAPTLQGGLGTICHPVGMVSWGPPLAFSSGSSSPAALTSGPSPISSLQVGWCPAAVVASSRQQGPAEAPVGVGRGVL